MSISSDAELFEVKNDWNADNFTWTAFGNSSLSIIEAIELFWFPTNPIARSKIHDIWKRHPQQQEARAPGISIIMCLPSINFHLIFPLSLFIIHLMTVI